jgi:hypothetical protein
LQQGPLLRAGLLQVEDQRYVLGFAMHHIVSDGWSMQILVREVLACYAAFSQGLVPSLPALRVHYKDYAHWQGQQLQGESFQAQRRYWLGQLEGPLPVVELPTDKARPPVKTYNGNVLSLSLSEQLSQSLLEAVPPAAGHLVHGTARLAQSPALPLLGPAGPDHRHAVAGREHFDLEEQIGFFVNTLPLRTRLEAQDSFAHLLTKVKTTSLEAYAHQLYPFDQLVEELPLQRDMSRSPLFDVMLVLQNNQQADLKGAPQLEGLQVQPYQAAPQVVSKFDLTFTFAEAQAGIELLLEYNSDLYGEATVQRLGRHFTQLLSALTAHPDQPIAQLDYLSGAEKSTIAERVQRHAGRLFHGQTLVNLFEEQVEKTPDAVALVFEEEQLSYPSSMKKANQLAVT